MRGLIVTTQSKRRSPQCECQ